VIDLAYYHVSVFRRCDGATAACVGNAENVAQEASAAQMDLSLSDGVEEH